MAGAARRSRRTVPGCGHGHSGGLYPGGVIRTSPTRRTCAQVLAVALVVAALAVSAQGHVLLHRCVAAGGSWADTAVSLALLRDVASCPDGTLGLGTVPAGAVVLMSVALPVLAVWALAGAVGLSLTALIILGVPISGHMSTPLRVLFWVALGVMSAAAFGTTFNIIGYSLRGITLIIVLVALLVAINFLVRGGRETLSLCLQSLAEGAKNALPVGIACALVGVIIGVLALTGAGSTFARVIVSVGENSLFFSLVLTMLACLVLGMGIPTIPNYIITSSIAGPALLHLEVPLLVSHMFVFYFGIMADLTPPVALAAFAAAPIARESGMKIGMQAIRIAVAGFAVPFMAVYEPVIMLQESGPLSEKFGFWPAFVYMFIKALLSILLWGAAAIGHLRTPLNMWERIWAFAAIALMLATYPYSDELGFAACATFLIWHFWRSRPSVVASSG